MKTKCPIEPIWTQPSFLYLIFCSVFVCDRRRGGRNHHVKVHLKNLSQQHLYFFKFDVEVFHFNPPKKEEKFVIFLEVEIFPPHTSFCFGLPARTAPSRFAVNGEEPLLRKKKKPSINHFLGNGSLIQQDGLSDDLQLLVINANSDLWPAVLHQNSSSTASSPRSKRPSAYWSPVMLAPQPCSSLYCFLHFFFLLFTSFHL